MSFAVNNNMTINTPERLKSLALTIETVYGTLQIDDPLIQELIEAPLFQRLKGIHQYGVVYFITPTESYSRFDHSLGVYHLLNKIHVSREQQIAGLLHDVSHTVFSHVGDYVFQDRYPGNSYQDDIHHWFLLEGGFSTILQKYGLSSEAIHHKNSSFTALDQPLPHLCADRIDYNLQGAYLRKLIDKKEFDEILESLNFRSDKQQWVFDSFEPALKLAHFSLKMTEELWGAAWEGLAYSWTADALRRSFEIGLVSFDEFHFSTDEMVWNKLKSSSDPKISSLLSKMQNVKQHFKLTELGQEDLFLRLKFRGLDPIINTASGLKPLTKLDAAFAHEYERVQSLLSRGWAIKLL